MSDTSAIDPPGPGFLAALDRFAAVAPRLATDGGAGAEIATRAARVRGIVALALECGPGDDPGTGDAGTLAYVSARLGAMLDIAEIAATLTGSNDGGFDERVFADNLAAFAPEDLHGLARLVSLDTADFGRCEIARNFDVLAGISTGIGPGLAAISKALIILGAFVLVLRGRVSPRRFRFLVEELFAIDGLLRPGAVEIASAPLDAETLRHCMPREINARAGEVTTYRFATESPPAGGIIEVTRDGSAAPALTVPGDTFRVVGKARVVFHYKSPNGTGSAGVEVRRQKIF